MDHIIDPAPPHGGHDHGFARRVADTGDADHDHPHDHGLGEYYLGQLMTIFICGAYGLTAVLMYHFDMLRYILAPKFQDPVLIGGIGLLAVVVLRGISLWRSVGGEQIHDHHGHDHGPGEICDDPAHAHGDPDHSVGDHAHGNIYWRIVVLAFPVVLFLMGLPNKTFSGGYLDGKIGSYGALGVLGEVTDRGGEATYDFQSLSVAAASEDKRRALEGTPAKIVGQLGYIPGVPDQFGLFYMKITCCATDMVPLKARIKVDRPSLADSFKEKFKHHDWVEVSGTIQFAKLENGEYLTVLRVKDGAGIAKANPVY